MPNNLGGGGHQVCIEVMKGKVDIGQSMGTSEFNCCFVLFPTVLVVESRLQQAEKWHLSGRESVLSRPCPRVA